MVRNSVITGGAGYIGSHVTEILLKKYKSENIEKNDSLIENPTQETKEAS